MGDELVGTYVGDTTGKAAHGEYRIALIREADTGEFCSLWLFQAVLRKEYEQAVPRPSDLIAVRCLKDHPDYKRFNVVVERVVEEPTADDVTF